MRAENSKICCTEISPWAEARLAVRAMRASISRSTKQLIANAAPANNQIPIAAGKTMRQLGTVSDAKNMPITAQKTASCVTRGLVNARYCARRLG